MSQLKRRTGIGWLALLACAFLFLASIGATAADAQVADPRTRSSGTLEGEDGAEAGDPDMPTGDTPPRVGATGSGTHGSDLSRAHGTTSGITDATPSKRYGQWAHWKIALKLLARGFYLR